MVDLVFSGSIAVILLVMAVNAALRGPWLDEFWTLELSDPRRGLATLVGEGWLRDTHPPAFNLWATLLSSLGLDSISLARLASNLPAAGLLMWAALSFSRRTPGDRTYHLAMLLLVLSLPNLSRLSPITGPISGKSRRWPRSPPSPAMSP